jgi:hypothetical protein
VSDGRSRPKSLAESVLVPAVAAVASAAAGYVAKNAPRLAEEKLLPKLRETVLPKLTDGGGPQALAVDLGERAKTLVQTHAPDSIAPRPKNGVDGSGGRSRSRPSSPPDRERARATRAAHRAERRRAST